MKLGLGTVQFGLNYGISNREGKSSLLEVLEIFKLASRNDIRIIDTASLYGTSEEVIGQMLPPNEEFRIVTKTPNFFQNHTSADNVRLLEDTFHQSLKRLGQSSVYGLLIHDVNDLFIKQGQSLINKMMEFKQQGLVKKIGVSIYSSHQIDHVLDYYDIDLIQLPINVLDQRLLLSGHLSKLKKLGIEVHARSIFLQGLLLMDPDRLPGYFDSIREHLRNYHTQLSQQGISALHAALSFVMGLKEVDIAVCGVNNYLQLEEIIQYARNPIDSIRYVDFSISDRSILNPSEWNL